ncbi:type II secretion system protein [Pseudoduganella flava]|nr:type II secretion system protein [Pseudoduganella flava]
MTRGFTIVELLVTIVIVSVLASAALPMAELAVRRNKEQELRRSLREIREALDNYKLATDEGRIKKSADASGYPPSLEVLVEGVEDIRSAEQRRLFFLRRIPRNPFADGKAPPNDGWGKRSYSSRHDDPKEESDVYDVYAQTEGTGMNGIPYREW